MNTLKQMREKSGLSQYELSKMLDVTQSTISMWETGMTFPRRKMLIKLSSIFKCSIYEFLKELDYRESKRGI